MALVVAGRGSEIDTVAHRTGGNEAWWIEQAARDARDGLLDWVTRGRLGGA